MTDLAERRTSNETPAILFTLLMVNLVVPILLSTVVANLPFGIPTMPVFWVFVVSILGLNVLTFRRFPQSAPFVGFLVAFNGLSTWVLGVLAFLPNLHIWVKLVFFATN